MRKERPLAQNINPHDNKDVLDILSKSIENLDTLSENSKARMERITLNSGKIVNEKRLLNKKMESSGFTRSLGSS